MKHARSLYLFLLPSLVFLVAGFLGAPRYLFLTARIAVVWLAFWWVLSLISAFQKRRRDHRPLADILQAASFSLFIIIVFIGLIRSQAIDLLRIWMIMVGVLDAVMGIALLVFGPPNLYPIPSEQDAQRNADQT